jgi:hypothetical protein
MGGDGASAYDFVLENEELWDDSLNGMSGDILVKGGIVMYSLSVPKEVKSIRFIGTECLYEMIAGEIATPCSIYGHSSVKISGIEGDYVELKNFDTVEDCHGRITLYNCSNVSICSLASLFNCSYVSKIKASEASENIIYSNCTYVDGDTCDGYYITEDSGKVQTVNTDGSKSLISVVEKMTGEDDYSRLYGVDDTGAEETFYVDMGQDAEEGHIPRRNANLSIWIPNDPVDDTDSVNKRYVDTLIGDIDSVLDNILAKQNAVIGGDA